MKDAEEAIEVAFRVFLLTVLPLFTLMVVLLLGRMSLALLGVIDEPFPGWDEHKPRPAATAEQEPGKERGR